jgi:hypothetical protein
VTRYFKNPKGLFDWLFCRFRELECRITLPEVCQLFQEHRKSIFNT